jgi:hypothetical protein
MTVAAESAGAHCASGGSKVTTGLDTNGNEVLDAGEITATAYICNGATGATGAAGAAGANGTNGTNGSNGSNGASGSNGVNSLVAIVPEPAGANCTYGGRSITSGLDLNSNTVLDVGEVSSTSYVCNGAVGATGPQGPAGPGVTWVNVTGTAVTAVANQGYVASAATQVTITLPDSSALAVGDIIQVVGGGAGGWKIAQNTGQIIFTSNVKNGATTNNFFTPHATQRNWSAVASSYDGTKLVATESGGLIYTSSDSGASWASHESVRNWSAVASSYDGTKLVATESGGLIYTSSDSGASWASHGEARYWKSVASSYDGTKLVAVSGALSAAPGIYRSSDSGITWTGAGPNRISWTSVASSSDGTKLIASIDRNGGYSISTDSGANWSAANPVGYVNSVASSADGTKLAYITQSGPETLNQLSTSVDSGLSFVNQNGYTASPNVDKTFLASSLDGKNLITVNYGGIVKTSIDSGVSWTDTDYTQWYFQKENNTNYTSVASSADGTKVVFAGDEGTFIYTSSAATSLGTSGSITGQGYDSIELIYIGTGQFRVVFPVNYLLVN